MLLTSSLYGQLTRPTARLSGPIRDGARQTLTGSRPPRAAAATDIGVLPGDTPIPGMTLVFTRTAAQEAALAQLLAAQQDPTSPQYHQWLTPESFGAQFGVADSDLAQVESWLQVQGFAIDRVTRAHDRITFSGTAAQVNAAFRTELHRYSAGSRVDFAPSTDLSLPAGMASMVAAVNHLSTFRPHSMVKHFPLSSTPAYTTTGTEAHFLTPKDVATMYDVNPVYSTGYTGTGQTIAIAGQTYIQSSDVAAFQTAAGLPANAPTLVLEPGTGASAIYQGDEFESDLDVEYSTGMAPAAKVLFVYTGDSPNYDAFDAFDYIIEENLAPVASVSYGACEPLIGSSYANAGNQLFMQGAAQGQTLIASSGDEGSTACFGATDNQGNALSAAIQEQLAISYPAASPYVTSIGGTQMAAGTFAAGNTQYWASAGSTPVISSLLSYVPEVVWNEDSVKYGFAAGGGGASIYFGAQTWQTGLTGVASTNTARLNPDISLQASTASPGYFVCSSDPTAFATGQTTSCTNGVYDSSGRFVEEAGGTSFGAPIFAGLMAVLNQQQQAIGQGTTLAGQGTVNPTIYSLAKGSGYGTIFHDITSGNNDCAILVGNCAAGLNAYVAGTGYDQASGLGSIDFANLLAAWPVVNTSTTTTLAGSTVTLTPATATPASGASDVISIAVGSKTGTPTGTVTVSMANEQAPVVSATGTTTPGASTAATLTLSNGTASYTFPGTTTAGTEVITVKYSGDATHTASTGSVALTLANTLTPTGSITFSTLAAFTVPANGVGQTTFTVTPTGGYNGLLNFTLPSLPATDCYAVFATATQGQTTVSGPTSMTLEVGNGTVCTSSAAVRVGNQVVKFTKGTASVASAPTPFSGLPSGAVLASVLMVGLGWRRRGKRLGALLSLTFLVVVGLGLSGCGGSNGSTVTTPTTPVGQTLALTLTGTDSVTTSITASGAFSVTVQ